MEPTSAERSIELASVISALEQILSAHKAAALLRSLKLCTSGMASGMVSSFTGILCILCILGL